MGEQKWTEEPWDEDAFYLDIPMMVVGEHALSIPDYQRAHACVNAMQGIADPAEFVRRVRAVVDEWNADHAAVTEPSLCVALVNLGEVLP